MYCTKDCVCALCREMRCLKPTNDMKNLMPPSPKTIKQPASATSSIFGRFNENFILRRRVGNSFKLRVFQPKSLKSTGIYQNIACAEEPPQRAVSTPSPTPMRRVSSTLTIEKDESPSRAASNHKVVIYFGDSLAHRQRKENNLNDDHPPPISIAPDAVTQLPQSEHTNDSDVDDDEVPPYIERVCDGVINIKIEGNYRSATALVARVSQQHCVAEQQLYSSTEVASTYDEGGDKVGRRPYNGGNNGPTAEESNDDDSVSTTTASFAEAIIDAGAVAALIPAVSQTDDSCDWSFVQKWRRRVAKPRPNPKVPVMVGQTMTPASVQLSDGPIINASVTPHIGVPSLAVQMTTTNNGATDTQSLDIQGPPVGATSVLCNSKESVQRPFHSVNGVSTTPIVLSSHVQTPLADSNASVNSNKSSNITNITSPNSNAGGVRASKPMQPYRCITGPAKLTVQSMPVKSQPAMVSGSLIQQQQSQAEVRSGAGQCYKTPPRMLTMITPAPSLRCKPMGQFGCQPSPPALQKSTHNLSTRSHQHHEFRTLRCVQECPSSSDENRSSGHASMSDGHGSSSPGGGVELGPLPEERFAAGVTNRSTRSRGSTTHSRTRQRAATAKLPWSGCGALEDVKLAIQQLTMRSQTSTSTYSSLSAGSESSEPALRLGHHSSVETVNTNVTSADEFIWVDSHNRLVELQHPPWSQNCIMRVIRNGRFKDHAERVPNETVSRLGYLLQRALVRVAREVQRLSANFGFSSKKEVAGAFKIVLCPAFADSCIKACLRAAAMFAVTGESALKQSKSARAGLQLSVGRFHRWMVNARLGKFTHEYSAVYLCAGMENLLEEILLLSLPVTTSSGSVQLSAAALDSAIAGSGDLWGLLQPFAHLNAGRIASGLLTMPCWVSQLTLGSAAIQNVRGSEGLEPCLLTTCVGSFGELKELAQRAQQMFAHVGFSNAALTALFYFMRCSQLEHSDGGACKTQTNAIGNNSNVQELCYERSYVVLPPLVEWLRVATAHAEYRSAVMIDKDDIMQAARLLLPGVDCPIRAIGVAEELPTKKTHFQPYHHGTATPTMLSSISEDTTALGQRATIMLAFNLLLTGRAELMAQAANLLPTPTRYDSMNHSGLTALMIASLRNDDVAIQSLLDAGCDPNVEVPVLGHGQCPAIHPDTQHWTALTFAASSASYIAVRMLLERGAAVEGGARCNEDKLTLTPLQVASAFGHVDVVSLLLAHGANGFLSTQQKDAMCSAGSAQRGCYSAISVAAAHGQRAILRMLLSHPMSPGSRDVLSLEEMLAEGEPTNGRNCAGGSGSAGDTPLTLSKEQIKCLQEAMYHSAENNHLDITIELRTLGVHWTLHCWMHALAAAHDLRLDTVIDQLLQDFLQVCPDDYSAQFVSECLPLLFNIFRYSKNEGTTLLLADIFATCFGWEQIKVIKQSALQPVKSSRIDPKFVNNSELSDVTFRVEGKIFYGHKIVLVTASSRFQSMLSSKLGSDGNSPIVQINDIRYNIFQLVMQYLYSGGCGALVVLQEDVLELMAAASFFQLESLQRYTESRCSAMINIENVVAMYIHAKVYSANKLLEYCQGFLLQNMVALLTYDDSVKRLLFAKKIPNHDVLSGLLQTLQQRIKQRKPNNVGHYRQHLSPPPASSK